MSVDDILEALKQINLPALSIHRLHSDTWGEYLLVIVDADAKTALEAWDKIVDMLKERGVRMPVFVDWTGETNVAPEELGICIGRAMAKMGLFLATKETIDAVKALTDEYNER